MARFILLLAATVALAEAATVSRSGFYCPDKYKNCGGNLPSNAAAKNSKYAFSIRGQSNATRVQISISDYEYDCAHDSILVFDGAQYDSFYMDFASYCTDSAKNASTIDLCDTKLNYHFVSTTNRMFLQFCTDNTDTPRKVPLVRWAGTDKQASVPTTAVNPAGDGSCGQSFVTNPHVTNGQITDGSQVQGIIGGAETAPHAYPWQVRYGGCGGSVLDKEWVITAAHCMPDPGEANGTVFLGRHRYLNDDRSYFTYETFWKCDVVQVHGHPDYNLDGERKHDLALLKIDCGKRFNFTEYVQPVCLPGQNDAILRDQTDALTIISGWGMNEYSADGGNQSPILKDSVVKIVDHATCVERFGMTADDSYIGLRSDEATACRGDSGGPLVKLTNGKWTLYGASSFGASKCTFDLPTIYADIQNDMTWISETATFQTSESAASQTTPPATTDGGWWPSTNKYTIDCSVLAGCQKDLINSSVAGAWNAYHVKLPSTLAATGFQAIINKMERDCDHDSILIFKHDPNDPMTDRFFTDGNLICSSEAEGYATFNYCETKEQNEVPPMLLMMLTNGEFYVNVCNSEETLNRTTVEVIM